MKGPGHAFFLRGMAEHAEMSLTCCITRSPYGIMKELVCQASPWSTCMASSLPPWTPFGLGDHMAEVAESDGVLYVTDRGILQGLLGCFGHLGVRRWDQVPIFLLERLHLKVA